MAIIKGAAFNQVNMVTVICHFVHYFHNTLIECTFFEHFYHIWDVLKQSRFSIGRSIKLCIMYTFKLEYSL